MVSTHDRDDVGVVSGRSDLAAEPPTRWRPKPDRHADAVPMEQHPLCMPLRLVRSTCSFAAPQQRLNRFQFSMPAQVAGRGAIPAAELMSREASLPPADADEVGCLLVRLYQ